MVTNHERPTSNAPCGLLPNAWSTTGRGRALRPAGDLSGVFAAAILGPAVDRGFVLDGRRPLGGGRPQRRDVRSCGPGALAPAVGGARTFCSFATLGACRGSSAGTPTDRTAACAVCPSARVALSTGMAAERERCSGSFLGVVGCRSRRAPLGQRLSIVGSELNKDRHAHQPSPFREAMVAVVEKRSPRRV